MSGAQRINISMQESHKKVLISGAGIAGATLAFWLARAGMRVIVVERSPQFRVAGQTIDIRGVGLDVVKRMNAEAAIRKETTKEKGIKFVDERDQIWAAFEATGGAASFVADIEIARGDLARVLYEASCETAEYRFGDYIKAIDNLEDHVRVTFNKGEPEDFDFVVASDGLWSKVRSMLFPDVDPIKSLGQYTAFFSIDYHDSDGTWSRWFNAPGGRTTLLRPDGKGCTRAFLSIMSESPDLENYTKLSIPEQKKLIRGLFSDIKWEVPRVLDDMDKSSDFYMQKIAQVKLNSWWAGRVALIGDAACCPSPISGMGTTVAIVGAYVLAGEIAKHYRNSKGADLQRPAAAFEAYEALMRPFVEDAQRLPPGAPAFANPQSGWGVKLFLTALYLAQKTGITKLFTYFGTAKAERIVLPDYEC